MVDTADGARQSYVRLYDFKHVSHDVSIGATMALKIIGMGGLWKGRCVSVQGHSLLLMLDREIEEGADVLVSCPSLTEKKGFHHAMTHCHRCVRGPRPGQFMVTLDVCLFLN